MVKNALYKLYISLSILTLIFSFAFAEEKLPYFKFRTDANTSIKKPELKGKPTVMIFWGIYCHTCRDELPRLEKLYQKYKDKVNFLAVVVDTDDIEEVKEFKNKLKFSYPVLFINLKYDLFKFKVFGTPTTLIISPDLKIVKRYIGDINPNELENTLNQLLTRWG